MASSYTSLLKFNKPALGDAGWGTSVNGGFTDMVEQALTGALSVAVTSGGTETVPTIADGVSSDARNQFITITGSLTSVQTATVELPAGTSTNFKLYFVKNSAGGTVTVTTATGTSVAVPNGASMILRVTNAGVETTMTYAASLTLGTALGATSGGTGQAIYAVGDLLYASSTTALSKLTVGATNAILTVAGGVPAWASSVPAVSGGTGQTSYAVGDIIYASSTTALSKLTVGATNAVLTVAAGIPSWVTTLPVASGGTGAATLAANNVLLGNGTSAVQTVAPGTAGNLLTSNGTTWTSAAAPSSYSGVTAQVFTSNGTFTIPSGVTKVKVTIVGGGGGSSGGLSNAEIFGGGGGGTAIKWLTGLTPGNTITVTVGAGGTAGTSAPTAGGAGGNSSIASGTQAITTVTGSGGGGAGVSGVGSPGTGGSATNGDINMPGSSSVTTGYVSGYSVLSTPRYDNHPPIAGNSVGGGSGGRAPATGGSTAGAAGAAGVVIFEW